MDNRAVGQTLGTFAFGGAIRMDDSVVLIEDSDLRENRALGSDPETGGGAIAQFDGELTVRRSALIDNWADVPCDVMNPDDVASTGGALRIEATRDTGAQAYFYDSTVSDNLGRVGGGIHVVAIADTGVGGIQDVFVNLMRTTLVHNEAVSCGSAPGLGDGVMVQRANGGQGLVAFGNSILHGNGRLFMGDRNGTDCSGAMINQTFVSLEGNVIDDDDQCPSIGFDAFAPTVDTVIDIVRNDDHYVPLANGPAVDLPEASINCAPEPDQLGNPRASGPGQGGSLCDAGAIELQTIGSRFTLDVTLDGNGTGSVASVPSGIQCPGTCSTDFDDGVLVELVATSGPDSSFAGWSGACTGTGLCTVTMNQARSVTASFETQVEVPLTVTILGGDARVTSVPAGIDCPGDCTADFPNLTTVDLVQTPDPGFEFVGWGGACSGDGACSIVMDQSRFVAANYTDVETRLLQVDVIGSGSVASDPQRIDCQPLCTAEFTLGQSVELIPTESNGATFVGWTGDCSGSGPCLLSMDADRQVTATFSQPATTFPLNVSVNGSGSVVSIPSGIDCPADCGFEFAENEGVQLVPSPAPGFVFDGWNGDCAGDSQCFLTMAGPRAVTANFAATNTLDVSVTGAGSVISAPAGIDCPDTSCSADFAPAEKVVLQPQAEPGLTFLGWSGDCTGTGPCTFDMSQSRSVTATFSEPGFVLQIVLDGDGAGQVFDVPVPGSIDCPGACSAEYPTDSTVALEAVADGSSVFQAFAGDCQGTTCLVTMDTDRTVRATFLSPQQIFIDSFE